MLCSPTLKGTEYLSNFLASDCTSKMAATVDIDKEVIQYFGIAMFGGKTPNQTKNPKRNKKMLGFLCCIKSCALKLVLQPHNFPIVMHFKIQCTHRITSSLVHAFNAELDYLYLALTQHLPNAFPYTLKPTFIPSFSTALGPRSRLKQLYAIRNTHLLICSPGGTYLLQHL